MLCHIVIKTRYIDVYLAVYTINQLEMLCHIVIKTRYLVCICIIK